MLNCLTESEAKKLHGRIELMSEKLYRRGAAIARLNNPPSGMTDGGKPLLISVQHKSDNSNRTVTRYLAAWHTTQRSQ